MLEFVNVSKSFWTGTQRKVILDRASFRVELGNSLGILAPNGTGKTTLINMMAGLEKPDEGQIHRGCRISFPLGFMGGVVHKHTAKENSRYIARLYGLDPDYIEAFCRWLCGIKEYFDMPQDSPYMLLAFPVVESCRIEVSEDQNNLWGIDLLKVTRSQIPAVTHVDYSARVQTIDKERNSFLHGMIYEFKQLTGCSVIINTSFNVRGEPIVNTPKDAYRCFMATEIDCLVLGNRLLIREEQLDAPLNENQRNEWLGRFSLD